MIREILLILKKTTFLKIGNAIKLYSSYLMSHLFKIPYRHAFPLSVSVEPASFCNLKCPECPTGRNELKAEKGIININTFRKAINELSPYLFNLILYFQGEPFLNGDIFEMIEYASKKKNIYTTTSTNGHFLSEKNCTKIIISGLDKLIISIDGTTQEVYEKYRQGGNLETVIQGIKNIVSMKKQLQSNTPLIVIQFIVFKFNEHQIDDIKKLSKSLKVGKLVIKSAQVYEYQNDNTYIPSINKYARYKKTHDGKYQIKNKLKNKCRRLYESSVITSTGNVLPCCFDKDAGHSFGNINTKTFKMINNDESAIHFRSMLLNNRKQIEICKNCTEGLYK